MAISTQRLRRVSNSPPLKLLIVEDDILLARALKRELERRGAEVTLTHTVKDALATTQTFDCSILDIELPDGDGISLGARLLSVTRTKRVVFFSGTRREQSRARAESLGVFVQKGDGFSAILRALYGDQRGGSRGQIAVGTDGEAPGRPDSSPPVSSRVPSRSTPNRS